MQSGSSGSFPSALIHSRWCRLAPFPVDEGQVTDVALLDGVGPGEPVTQQVPVGLESDVQRLEVLGRRDLGHRELVGQPGLVDMEGRRHVEDGPSMLDGDHPAGGERSAVADPVHLVEDGDRRVAGSQEVGVEGMDPADFDRAAGGHQGLGGDLAAEHPLPVLVGADASEDVDFDGLEIEQVDEEIECVAHRPILPGVPGLSPLRWRAMAAISFPDGFQWGTATAAHQIEGGNVNNDWWEFEHDPTSGCVDRSGDACDSFHRYPEDIALVASLGLSFYRFSLEWSRIEPEEGEFSRSALDHYRRMLATCREHDLVPMVTYHHFTHPRWLASAGTWEAPQAVDRFARYCERVTAHLGDLIGMAGTINEPNVVATMGWRHGLFPPRVRDRDRRAKVNDALVAAHRAAVEAIRSGPGRVPGRPDPVDDRLSDATRRRGVGRADSAPLGGRVPRVDRGGRLHWRPDLHPLSGRAGGGTRPRVRGADHPDGLRVLPRGPGGDHPSRLG